MLLAGWLAGFAAAAQKLDLFPAGSAWRYFKGTQPASSPDPAAWRQPAFNDSAWATGDAAFHYGDSFSGTLLNDMRNNYLTVFLRKKFTVANPADIRDLILQARCDDGFIAWINGKEVLRFNVPDGELGIGSSAIQPAEPDPAVFNDYFVTDPRSVLVAGENIIAVHLFNVNLTSSDVVFDAALIGQVDDDIPVLTRQIPPPGAQVRELFQIEVQFNEPVTGVDAADLLVGGAPAAEVQEISPGQFVFSFPGKPAGPVAVAFKPDHGITDLASTAHPFAGGSWSYTVDPTLPPPGLLISEFMADNGGTLRDEDGEESDWIEIHNSGSEPALLFGWALTDDMGDLGKWKFPNLTLPAGGYLVVFASANDRTSTAGRLHTNFRLSAGGEFLGLVSPAGEIVSGFAPAFPPQRRDVSYGRANGAPNVIGFFDRPTPGAANAASGSGFAPSIRFSEPGHGFVTSVNLELSLIEAVPGAVIRYTLDGSLPTEASPAYSQPLAISVSQMVRARAFAPGLLPGDPRTEMYLKLDGTVPSVRSDLPIFILHNSGGGRPPSVGTAPGFLHVYEPVNGVTSLTNPPTLTSRVGLGARGSSTLGLQKVSMNLELRDNFDADEARELLGLPEESDWVLYAPNNFEPILIHNPFAHQLSRDIGRYSPRTRFIELFLVTDQPNASVRTANYYGVYVLEERIKRDPERVDVDKLEPEHTQPPEVTGGYLLKIDRGGPGEGGFFAANQNIIYVEPPEEEIELPERSAQRQYLQGYMNAFGTALYGANYRDPVNGYAAYVDVDSWIDHHLLNVLTFNVDALRLSAYFYKPREGKLHFGPLWDFDRALNSTDGRDANPQVWRAPSGDGGTDFFGEGTQRWWGRMFTDLEFFQRWIDRYQELRRDHFATTNLHRLVDELTTQVRQAQPREQARWNWPIRSSFQNEITILKNWLTARTFFMDGQFVRPPAMSRAGGRFDRAASVLLFNQANNAGTIHYTVDGTDPRAPGGAVAPGARVYDGSPIVMTNNARVVARVQNPSHTSLIGVPNPPLRSFWSGPVAATFFNVTPPLLLTEIMFHPGNPPAGDVTDSEQFEFVELKNVSETTLNLTGFRISGGIEYTFTAASAVTSLAPGARVLVVKNRAAFTARYPGVTGIAGEFTGQLANNENTVRITGPLEEVISETRYQDSWAPLADGFGFSLVLRDEATPFEQLGDETKWRLSANVGGSPGAADPEPPMFPAVFVNEALTHTDPPLLDSVELWNAGGTPAELGGWWLTDDFGTPEKYRVPAGTTLAPGAFMVFTEEQFRPGGAGADGFSLSALGDSVYLFSADAAGELTGYHHGFNFAGAFNGVSFGRLVTTDGRQHFVPQTGRTPGAANAAPVIGPLVITEIHYEPAPVGGANNVADEFIEVRNALLTPLRLADPAHPTNRWELRDGIEFKFPDITLPAGGFALVVGFDPLVGSTLAGFRTRFGVPAEVPVLGPWTGTLNNAGETLRLVQPDEPVSPPADNAGEVPFVEAEVIRYRPEAPWPTGAAATGSSLQRLRSRSFGNEPANWEAAAPTPGRINNPGDSLEAPADTDGDGLPDDWEAAFGLNQNSATGDDGPDGDPDLDGQTNRDEYVAGTHPKSALSRLQLEVVPGATTVAVRFQAVAGRSYSVRARDALESGTWELLQTFPTQAQDGVLEVGDPGGQTPRFYQLTVTVP